MGIRFRSARGNRPRAKQNPRRRLLVWATLFALVAGIIELGAPLESYLRMLRDLARSESASGEVVVVAIDDRSLQSINTWPWPRRHHAALLDRLRSMGAERVFFDFFYPSATNEVDDRLMAEALRRHRGRAFLAARWVLDTRTAVRYDQLPIASLAANASIVSIIADHDFMGVTWRVPFAERMGGHTFASMPAAIAGVQGDASAEFPIDYGIDYNSVPVISAADLMSGPVPSQAVRGRTVVVAGTSQQMGDMCLILGRGLVPCAYVQVLGAETLRRGMPVDLGWIPALIAAFGIAALALRPMSRVLAASIVTGGICALLVAPAFLEGQLLFVKIAPALFLLLIVGTGLGWSIFKQIYRERGAINATSGLPTLEAMRQRGVDRAPLLIAAKVQNYAEIVSALPGGSERVLVEQIRNRITLGATDVQLYQGDDGIFAWFAGAHSAEPAEDHLDALHALFRSPVTIAGTTIDLTIRFGVDGNIDRSAGGRLAGAIVAADEAAAEGIRWKRYDAGRVEEATWRLSLLSQLDRAMDSGDLWVAYQPKLDLSTGKIAAAEALVRWTHPVRGAISPSEFIPAAEQSNRIERLTYFVLDRALRGAATIRARGLDFGIAVNLSARLIEHKSLEPMVRQLLTHHKVPANRLTLEVTETATLSSQGARLEALEDLREAGVQISIDDYGTGLSTLEYLKKVPAHEIKIDKSFVHSICKSQSDRLLVHSTIQLAHSLGRKVVAEGVEDQATLAALQSMGCDGVQGYLIGRPMNFRDFIKLIYRERRSAAA